MMLEKLKELLRQKKSLHFYATKLGVSVEEVKKMLKELKKQKKANTVSYKGKELPDTSYKVEVDVENGTLSSIIELDFDAKDPEELARLHKVDLTKYKISSFWSKLKSNGKFTSSVFATLKKPQDYTAEDFAKFLESYIPSHIFKATEKNHNLFPIDVEFSIADFHLGKKTLEKETIYDKVAQFKSVLRDLVNRVTSVYKIDSIVFPISNDFFHTDNYQNQTTNGTPQDVLTGFDHEYEIGFDLLVWAIDLLQSVAGDVEVVLVQGNHDRTKSFYLAHALEVYFKNNEKVWFKRNHSTTKAVVLGETFIGYHHGNCKIDDLPLLFATGEYSQDFGNAKYREVHTGDKHHYMAKEVKGVRIQQMPSLSGTDRWHLDNNYVHSVRAGIATCYDAVNGRVAEFESRI